MTVSQNFGVDVVFGAVVLHLQHVDFERAAPVRRPVAFRPSMI